MKNNRWPVYSRGFGSYLARVTRRVLKKGSMVLAHPTLLEKIDKLFACNVGEYIDLPQLVVVGDQSSGKSSVPEGLTNLKFPRNSGLCTRFATQIIFRRDPSLSARKVSGSITSTADDDEKKTPSWGLSDAQTLNGSEFENMINEVGCIILYENNKCKTEPINPPGSRGHGPFKLYG